jgi:hypothetical protein
LILWGQILLVSNSTLILLEEKRKVQSNPLLSPKLLCFVWVPLF